MSQQYILRSDWGTPAKEEDTNTSLPQGFVDHLCSFLTPSQDALKFLPTPSFLPSPGHWERVER